MVDFAFSDFIEDSILNNFFRNTVSTAAVPDVALFIQPAGNTFTTTFASDQIDDVGHGLVAGDTITMSTSAADLPAGFLAATRYYVINANVNDFQVALSFGGTLVAISDDGTGTHQWHVFMDDAKVGQTEATGGGYSRQAPTFGAPTTSNDRRQVTTTGNVEFVASGGNLGGGEISTVAIFDAGTNMLCYAPITPVTVADGNTLRFATGNLTVQMN